MTRSQAEKYIGVGKAAYKNKDSALVRIQFSYHRRDIYNLTWKNVNELDYPPPPHQSDKEDWETLFAAYQQFYRAKIPAETIENTWKRIHDSSSNVNALVAELNNKLVGITHYLFHDSTWNNRPNCYLEDLYVDKHARGNDIARKLIEGVEAAARENDAFRLYWHTQEYNGAARSLYDSIMPPSSFMVYRKNL